MARWRFLRLRSLAQNLSMKVFSLGVSLLLFAFVSVENSTPLDVDFRLEYRFADDFMLVNDTPAVVHTTLRGPWAAFRSFDPNDLEPVIIDLQLAEPGLSRHFVNISSVHPPGGMRVVAIRPSEIEVALDRRVERQVSVHADIADAPAAGFELVESRIEPPRVRVVGPATKMQALEFVSTRSVHLAGSEDDVRQEIELRPPQPPLRLLDRRVVVVAEIREELSQRTLPDVPVDVVNGPRGSNAEPETVLLTLKGPRRALQAIDANGLRAVVDVQAERKAGLLRAERAVHLNRELPENTQLLGPIPKVVVDLNRTRKPKKGGPSAG